LHTTILDRKLPPGFATGSASFRWLGSERVLVYDTDVVMFEYVPHSQAPGTSALIEGVGKIAYVEFGQPDQILVFSEGLIKLTIWSTTTARGIELRDPKFTTKGYSYRHSGHFAFLSRPGQQDILTIHEPGSYEVIASVVLPTSDAQGVKWSPDGRWLAVWDSPSSGCRVLIYTADGNLYRTYSGNQDIQSLGLGIRSIEWCGSELAIGDHDRRITILKNNTVSLMRCPR
jgi:WD40 repeat protein